MRLRAGFCGGLVALLVIVRSGTVAAEVIAVQCTVDEFRSSFASRPDLFTVQVDLEARSIVTYYASMRLKMTRRELRGVSVVPGGWQSHVAIDRNSGKIVAGTDRIEGRRYFHADLKGTCILPPELRGAGYKVPTGG